MGKGNSQYWRLDEKDTLWDSLVYGAITGKTGTVQLKRRFMGDRDSDLWAADRQEPLCDRIDTWPAKDSKYIINLGKLRGDILEDMLFSTRIVFVSLLL